VPKSRSQEPDGTVPSLTGQHWTQSYPFSCGPAALGSMLTTLGWTSSRGRSAEELALWREVTAVACPGAHPLGLALAARRRGFSSEVRIDGTRPWLGDHIRSAHHMLRPRDYSRVEGYLLRECEELGIPVRWGAVSPRESTTCLLLVAERGRSTSGPDPHWVGLIPTVNGVWVSDPLRRRRYPSRRSLAEWWDNSGFDGTKSWVGIWKSDATHPTPGVPNPAVGTRPERAARLKRPDGRKHP